MGTREVSYGPCFELDCVICDLMFGLQGSNVNNLQELNIILYELTKLPDEFELESELVVVYEM